MSLDLSIFAVVPSTDPKFKKYVEVYKACAAAGVDIPAEVNTYFKGDEPNPDGLERELMNMDDNENADHISVTRSNDAWEYTIDISQLPPDTKKIKISLSA